MKRIAIFAVGIMLMALSIPAFASQSHVEQGYYTFIWELPHAPTGTGANAPWPQDLVGYAYTGNLGTHGDLDYLDDEIPECGYFQIDVYKINSPQDIERLKTIIEAQVLNWPDDSPIYKASKFVEKGPCESTTTTTIGTTTTTENSTTTTQSETTSTSESTTSSSSTTTSTTLGSSSTAPSTTPTTPPTSQPPTLPFTGSESTSGGLVGFGLLIAGIATLGVGKRMRDGATS